MLHPPVEYSKMLVNEGTMETPSMCSYWLYIVDLPHIIAPKVQLPLIHNHTQWEVLLHAKTHLCILPLTISGSKRERVSTLVTLNQSCATVNHYSFVSVIPRGVTIVIVFILCPPISFHLNCFKNSSYFCKYNIQMVEIK